MARKTIQERKLPTVLSFERKLVPSDGLFYGTTWENRHEKRFENAIVVKEKSVRGTISNKLQPAEEDDPAKINAKIQNANPQTVDSASLKSDQDTLKVCFTLKILSGVQRPSACNDAQWKLDIQKIGEEYIKQHGFEEPAHRYATNIASGRFLWRNRVGAERIEVTVRVKPSGEIFTFDGYDYSLKNFDKRSPELDQLAQMIANVLCERMDYLLLEIEACALMGRGQEVYPSQELIMKKEKDDSGKSKVLYQVDGNAAMHSQKIGNALRTIDTCYIKDKERQDVGPIAIEPYGAVTAMGQAYRRPTDEVDFYTLFNAWASGSELNDTAKDYVMAVLVRGGVFSESGKGKK